MVGWVLFPPPKHPKKAHFVCYMKASRLSRCWSCNSVRGPGSRGGRGGSRTCGEVPQARGFLRMGFPTDTRARKCHTKENRTADTPGVRRESSTGAEAARGIFEEPQSLIAALCRNERFAMSLTEPKHRACLIASRCLPPRGRTESPPAQSRTSSSPRSPASPAELRDAGR